MAGSLQQVLTNTLTEDMKSHKRKAEKFPSYTCKCFHYENYAILEIITEEEETLVLPLSSAALSLFHPCQWLVLQYSQDPISHCLARDGQRTCGAQQLLTQNFSASGTAAPWDGNAAQRNQKPWAGRNAAKSCDHDHVSYSMLPLPYWAKNWANPFCCCCLIVKVPCDSSTDSTWLSCTKLKQDNLHSNTESRTLPKFSFEWNMLKVTNLYLLCYIN